MITTYVVVRLVFEINVCGSSAGMITTSQSVGLYIKFQGYNDDALVNFLVINNF